MKKDTYKISLGFHGRVENTSDETEEAHNDDEADSVQSVQ